MRLRIKALLILAGIWAAISVLTYVYSKHVLVNEYAQIEEKFVIDDIQQTQKTLTSILSSLKLLNTDWANWDDAYTFMKNKNERFIQSNLKTTTFANAKLTLILFYDVNGQLFYGLNYNNQNDRFDPIPENILNHLQSEKRYIKPNAEGSQGIIKTGDHYTVISAMPILNSESKGPTAGTLIMGYAFDNQQIEKLADIINMKVTLFPLPAQEDDVHVHTAHRHFLESKPYYVASANDQLIFGFAPVNNLENQLIGILRISMPRTVYNTGVSTIENYLNIIMAIGLLFMLTMWWLLQYFVLSRIIDTSHQIAEINQKGIFNQPIKISGHDELSSMVASFNHLLEIISITHEQLKRRVTLRTEELMRLSELNKNLFSEMSEQKSIETQLREQEKLLRQMAYYDALTGLPNRMYFQELLEKSIHQSERTGTSFAILFLDADDFKHINDTYGHDVGDKYLVEVSKILKCSIKDCDVAARLGGDEFIVFLANIRARPLIQKATEKILQAISTVIPIEGVELSCQFSVGISIYPEDGLTTEDLEKHADYAMYYAKRQVNQAYAFYRDVCELTPLDTALSPTTKPAVSTESETEENIS